MKQLRAICPQTCGCLDTISPVLGIYQHENWGCPSRCFALRTARLSSSVEVVRPCTDILPPVMLLDTESQPFRPWLRKWLAGLIEFAREAPNFATNVQGMYRPRVQASPTKIWVGCGRFDGRCGEAGPARGLGRIHPWQRRSRFGEQMGDCARGVLLDRLQCDI